MIETIKKIFAEFQILQNASAKLFIDFVHYLPKLIAGIFVFILFYFFYRVLRFVINRSLKKSEIADSLNQLIIKIVKYFCLSIALLLVADQIGIKIITLISTFGVVGIALGLAAQQTIANFISGIIILVSKPFKERDFVELEGVYGQVKHISLRSTAIITLDNLLVDIPNRNIVESKVINHTFNRHIRLRIGVGIAYKESIIDAQEVLLKIVENDSRFLKHPAPEVVVDEIADSSINLELLVWINNSFQEIDISYELRKKVKLALDEAGIQIPFPHRQVFVESIPARRDNS